jgi:hypothetical protein
MRLEGDDRGRVAPSVSAFEVGASTGPPLALGVIVSPGTHGTWKERMKRIVPATLLGVAATAQPIDVILRPE